MMLIHSQVGVTLDMSDTKKDKVRIKNEAKLKAYIIKLNANTKPTNNGNTGIRNQP